VLVAETGKSSDGRIANAGSNRAGGQCKQKRRPKGRRFSIQGRQPLHPKADAGAN
jgi:hypothetical protein